MRQAGRYLPEYREVRAKAGGFLDLCYTPALAAEVTLQPIRRYGFDAAILFSDILVVPDALGQGVRFVEGEGPRLDPIASAGRAGALDPGATGGKFARVCETVARLRQDLPAETALIGFCGAPWTVATYMVGGQGSSDQAEARLWAYRDPAGFQRADRHRWPRSRSTTSTARCAPAPTCCRSSTAGPEACPTTNSTRWVVAPTQRMVAELKRAIPACRSSAFRAGRAPMPHATCARPGSTGWDATRRCRCGTCARWPIAAGVAVQGNLDPLLLVAGGAALEARVREILEAMAARRSSSTSATASCRRRRPRTSRGWSSWCAAKAPDPCCG